MALSVAILANLAACAANALVATMQQIAGMAYPARSRRSRAPAMVVSRVATLCKSCAVRMP
eukprot:6186746-Alexandrium_andersonii.AAC.1